MFVWLVNGEYLGGDYVMFIYTIGDIIAVAWTGLWVILFGVLFIRRSYGNNETRF